MDFHYRFFEFVFYLIHQTEGLLTGTTRRQKCFPYIHQFCLSTVLFTLEGKSHHIEILETDRDLFLQENFSMLYYSIVL